MIFGNPVAWWIVSLLVAAAAGASYAAYAGAAVPLAAGPRRLLRGLRASTVLLLIALFLQPLVFDRRDRARNAVVPILIDNSRSMALGDADGTTRLARAQDLVARRLVPALGREFQVDLLSFGDGLAPLELSGLDATARQSDLAGALASVRERYAGRTIAGIVVLSDGGETGAGARGEADGPEVPVFPIGIGARVVRDREILSVAAGEATLAESVVDLAVSVVSHGFGRQPMTLTVRENGQPIQVRTVTPIADGSPVHVVFRVSPKKEAPTLYAVEVAPDASEITAENNARRALVRPPGRPRRVLLVEGRPGFEHSFLKRALDADPALEIDAVVRKGQNERGADTFHVQAAEARAAGLLDGYPAAREALYGYDGLVLANVESDFFTRDEIAMTADFVAARGGGLLVLGARSFDHQAWLRTPLEDVLPVELTDRTGFAVPASDRPGQQQFRLILTAEGARHAVMRLAPTEDDTRKRWMAAPALAAMVALGTPRPGATVLAEAMGSGDVARPLVALQRYGEGRAMVFSGEASWRWKMQRPSDDRLYDTFWRQAVRWLCGASPDPIAVSVPAGVMPGDQVSLSVMVRNAQFAPVRDATVTLAVTGPGGAVPDVQTATVDQTPGRYASRFRAGAAGVYRVRAEARRGDRTLGAAEQVLLVGGADEELADPRLNDEALRRVAFASGGELLAEADVAALRDRLVARAPDPAPPAAREIGHAAWALLLLLALPATEWTLRRRWGMR